MIDLTNFNEEISKARERMRRVIQYHTEDGEFLAENDTWVNRPVIPARVEGEKK